MYKKFGKRLLDLSLASLILVPALLVAGVCTILIYLDDRQNALFRQIRVGKQQRPFTLYKLRTMKLDTAHCASHQVPVAAVTRIGRILRNTKLDEIPQLINIFRGDMSFVGPRPCLPSQTELVGARDRLGVYEAQPGITGFAQLAGLDMSTPVELAQADAAYLANISLAGDLKYLVRTALGKGSGDAVKAR